MFAYRLRAAAIALTAAVGLTGCASYGYGGGYGYNGVSVGISSGYYDPYYGYGYDIPVYRYGGGYPYYGWYDGFYYPGTGYYVYDRYRRPHRWSDRHRRYWTTRRERSLIEGFRGVATNWSDFDRSRSTSSASQIRRSVDRPVLIERSTDRRIERSQQRIERSSARTERQSARADRRSEARAARESRSNGRGRDNNRER